MIPTIPKSKIYYRRKALEQRSKATDYLINSGTGRPIASASDLFSLRQGDHVVHVPTGRVGKVSHNHIGLLIGDPTSQEVGVHFGNDTGPGGDRGFYSSGGNPGNNIDELRHHIVEMHKEEPLYDYNRDKAFSESQYRPPKNSGSRRTVSDPRQFRVGDRVRHIHTGEVMEVVGREFGDNQGGPKFVNVTGHNGDTGSILVRDLEHHLERDVRSKSLKKVKASGPVFQTNDGERTTLVGGIPSAQEDMEEGVRPKKAPKLKKKQGCLMAMIPEEFSDRVLKWTNAKIPTSKLASGGVETNPHVTIKYGLTRPLDDSMRALLTRHGPISITLQDKLSTFKDQGDAEVLKVGINSHDLESLNRIITQNYENEDSYPEYQPHLTLAYINPTTKNWYLHQKPNFLKQNLTIKEVKYVGADGKEEIIPLSHHFSGEKSIRLSRDRGTRKDGRPIPRSYRVSLHAEEGLPSNAGYNQDDPIYSRAYDVRRRAEIVAANMADSESQHGEDHLIHYDDDLNEKAMSWLSGNGADLVRPPAFGSTIEINRNKRVKPSPFRGRKSLPFESGQEGGTPSLSPTQEPLPKSQRPEPPILSKPTQSQTLQRAVPRPLEALKESVVSNQPQEPPKPLSLAEHASQPTERALPEDWTTVHPHQQNANTRRQKEQEESYQKSEDSQEVDKEVESHHKEIKVSREKLTTLRVSKISSLGGGINESHILDFDNGTKGVFKPSSGENLGVPSRRVPNPEGDKSRSIEVSSRTPRRGVKPGTYYQREVGCSVIANYMGGGHMVPQTVVREVEGSVGSVQSFAHGAKTAVNFSGQDKFGKREDASLAACLDYAFCHLDRWDKNWLKGSDGKLVLIDNGLAIPHKYHAEDFQAVDFWTNAIENNLEISKHFTKHRRYIEPTLRELKKLGIEDSAIALTKQRLSALTSGSYGLVSSLPSLFDPRASLRTMMRTIDTTLASESQAPQFATRPHKQRPRKA